MNDKIKLTIKSHISGESQRLFKEDVKKITNRELLGERDYKYVLFRLFIQLGKPDNHDHVLDYRDKDDIYVYIQPKIKNHILFKSKDALDKYLDEELDSKELCIVCEIKHGQIWDII